MRRALVLPALWALSVAAPAQSFFGAGTPSGSLVRGVPPSVTSIGANHLGNVPASVTSLRSVPLCCDRRGRPFTSAHVRKLRRPYVLAPTVLPVPVFVPDYDLAADPPEESPDVPPAGVAATRQLRPKTTERTPQTGAPAAPLETPRPQPLTVLIFQDGHRMEVQNYAIAGSTLFNLSENGPRQVALDDLDIDATIKANNDRGIIFRLPRKT
ncbi:MAG: hypothetical protein JO041_06890 [Acidobacteria bacterium]|nr:hypothetical protein [Acidobacteriota bacterium]